MTLRLDAVSMGAVDSGRTMAKFTNARGLLWFSTIAVTSPGPALLLSGGSNIVSEVIRSLVAEFFVAATFMHIVTVLAIGLNARLRTDGLEYFVAVFVSLGGWWTSLYVMAGLSAG